MLVLMVLFFLTPLGVLAVISVTGAGRRVHARQLSRPSWGTPLPWASFSTRILLGARVVATVTLLGVPHRAALLACRAQDPRG